MNQDVIELNGKKPGPTSVILVGVHGNEKCGIRAIEELLPTLTIDAGKSFIIYGNPEAISKNVRFVDVNLNRLFGYPENTFPEEFVGYEYMRVGFLRQYLNQADYMLDIHASLTPDSKPFLICEKRSYEIAKYLQVPLVVTGFGKFQRGTDYYMDSLGKVGICLECGYVSDKKSVVVAKDAIISFLKAVGHLNNDLEIIDQEPLRLYDMYQTKTDNFKLTKKFFDFELIKKGQLIGIDGAEEIQVNRDSYILFARDRNKINEEAFLLAEKENGPA